MNMSIVIEIEEDRVKGFFIIYRGCPMAFLWLFTLKKGRSTKPAFLWINKRAQKVRTSFRWRGVVIYIRRRKEEDDEIQRKQLWALWSEGVLGLLLGLVPVQATIS